MESQKNKVQDVNHCFVITYGLVCIIVFSVGTPSAIYASVNHYSTVSTIKSKEVTIRTKFSVNINERLN